MKPQLNHTIVHAIDQRATADFLSEVLGLDPPVRVGHFLQVETGNGVGLDVMQIADGGEFVPQHYAFLVTERQFDEIFGRIRERGLEHWPEPRKANAGQINHHDGGRGVYFCDPGGNFLEILTRPYGSGPLG
jgi:hypothetical protein